MGDNLYIFGGEGSFTGNQGIVEDYFYDLYKVDLNTFEETLVWEAEEPLFGRFIPGENLVYDAEDTCFYTTAITEKDFMLVKIAADEPVIEQMSLQTDMRINANIQYTNLYRNNSGNELYALFIQSNDSGATKVDVMNISLPLFPVKEVLLPERQSDEKDALPVWAAVFAAIAAVCLILFAIITLAGRMKNRKKTKDTTSVEDYYDFSRNCISLFGGFRVLDRNGEDITSNFSQTLRKLLIALILHTVKYKQGIPGEKLNQLIWDYKPEGTASNNRNVYISRLRTALENMDGITINTKNKFLSISFSDSTICDYVEAIRLYETYKTVDDMNRLLSLLFKGKLLPNSEDEWIEAFKNEYSSMTLSFLSTQLGSNIPNNLKLKIADTIILYDKLN